MTPFPTPQLALPPAPPKHGLGFALFLGVNACLFLRPSDIIPGLIGLEIYRYVLLACLMVSFPAVLEYLAAERITDRPIDVCVYLMFPFWVLATLANSGFDPAIDQGVEYAKILVYYVLLVSLVTTPQRVLVFGSVLVMLTTVVTAMSALDFNKVIAIPRIVDPVTGKVTIDPDRMYGPGIFQDPNDLCVLIVTAMMLLLGRFANPRAGLTRWLWLVPLGVFGYGFYLTQSRGGLLALLAGLTVVVRCRYGWSRLILLACVGVPLLPLVLGGRQIAISASTDTGQLRIQLWNEGLVMVRGNPLFGAGVGQYQERAGQVAHSSYMQAFGELGFGGGMLFLGAVVLAVQGLWRVASPGTNVHGVRPMFANPELPPQLPFLAGAVTAYCAGMLTLTLNPMVTTYTMFGLASATISMAVASPPVPRDRFDLAQLVRLGALAAGFLMAMFVFVRLTLQV